MSRPIDLDTRRESRPAPLRVRDASDLEGKVIPKRDWLIPSVLVRRSITLFTGDGGVGKSLMSQCLQVAAALGRDWVGLPVPIMNSFAMYCEDDDDELDRRFEDICKYYDCRFSDLEGRVRYISRVGEENEMVGYAARGDRVPPKKTPLFAQVQEEIDGWGAQLIIIDTAGDVFGGNENARPQVRSFVNIIRKLALPHNGGVILNAHPSKSSLVDGSNFSGSTAWHGSCRNRIFLSKPKRKPSGDEDDDGPTDERELRIMKSNYSQGGGKIHCKWENGVIIETQKRATQGIFERLDDDRRIVDAAAYLIQRGAKLAANPMTQTSLVVLVRKLPSCKDIAWKNVVAAQDRMIENGKLVLTEMGPTSKRIVYVRPFHLKYPGEQVSGATETPKGGHPAANKEPPL
jgi:RecA-family ATPase